MRVLIGGIGYRNLRDHSLGIAVSDRLEERPWPEGVVVEDVSYNPIAVVQRLEDEPRDGAFVRAILVAAVERGRPPATITAYRWDRTLPPDDEIQRAITEAVTGVIALDNTVVVGGHFGAWPRDLVIVEVEPAMHEFGEAFSPPVAAVFDTVCALVTRLATDDAAVAALPSGALGALPVRTT